MVKNRNVIVFFSLIFFLISLNAFGSGVCDNYNLAPDSGFLPASTGNVSHTPEDFVNNPTTSEFIPSQYDFDKDDSFYPGRRTDDLPEQPTLATFEEVVRALGIISSDEKLISYQEGTWERKGGETYLLLVDLEVEKDGVISKRKFASKAILKMGTSVIISTAKRWLDTNLLFQKLGTKVPKFYSYYSGSVYQEYLPYDFIDYFNQETDPTKRRKFIKQLAHIAATIDLTGFSHNSSFVRDLMTDGNDAFYVDYGEDLGSRTDKKGTTGYRGLIDFLTDPAERDLAIQSYEESKKEVTKALTKSAIPEDLFEKIIPAVVSNEKATLQTLFEEEGAVDYSREVLIFFKPENLLSKDFFEIAMDMLFEQGIEISEIKAMNGAYIREREIIRRHYFAMHRSSTNVNDLGDEIHKTIHGKSDLPGDPVHIVGGLNSIQEINDILSAQGKAAVSMDYRTLIDAWRSTPGRYKAASGVHVNVLEISGIRFAIVNGFYRDILDQYENGTGILAISLRLPEEFEVGDLRKLVGSTDPLEAEEGTIRQIFARMSIRASIATNGIHASAGYLESFREIMNIMEVWEIDKMGLYKTVIARGMSPTMAQRILIDLVSNPLVNTPNGRMPAYDYTEDMDLENVIEFLFELSKDPEYKDPPSIDEVATAA